MRLKSPSLTKSALAAVALAMLAAPAGAQQLSHNAKGPVDISSDEAVANNSECTSTWKGNVEVLQDDARLRSDTLSSFLAKKSSNPGQAGGGCGEIIRLEAHGNVYYVTPQQRVRGDDAIYTASNDTLIVTGDVIAVQGQNVLRGTRLVVNTNTGAAQMVSNQKGRNKPGRVRGVFYPQDDKNQGQGQANAGSTRR